MFTCLLLSLQTDVDHTSLAASQPLLEGSGHCAVYESRFASMDERLASSTEYFRTAVTRPKLGRFPRVLSQRLGDSRATEAGDGFVYADE
jgi:hypothetical protein